MIGWTTAASRTEAGRIAGALVEAGLAACAQVSGPISSVYRWDGRVETAEEFRVMVKFAAFRAGAIGDWLNEHHGYDTPQWICCPAGGGTEKYLKWVVDDSS